MKLEKIIYDNSDSKGCSFEEVEYKGEKKCGEKEVHQNFRGDTFDSKPRALMLASVASMIDLFNMDNIEILLSLGYQVDVAANFNFGSITSQERVNKYKQELKEHQIGVYNIPIPRSLSKVKKMIVSYRQIKSIVNINHYSLVHCHSPIGGVLCRLACRKARKHGTRVIYTAHGFHFYKGASLKAWMIYYPVERVCSNFTDLLITINQEDYKAAQGFHTCEIAYIPGIGIHVDEIRNIKVERKKLRAEFGYKDSDFVFMSTGQISVRKNHEVVIRALAEIYSVYKNSRNIRYLIVGFGEEEERLKALVKDLKLEDVVMFAGYRSDVKKLLHIVDAFVFPSIQEGLPVALMEAMASGLPIVASRVRGNVDLIEDGVNGWLVKYDDCHGFARAMMNVKDNGGIQIECKKIENYDFRYIMDKMLELYKGIER